MGRKKKEAAVPPLPTTAPDRRALWLMVGLFVAAILLRLWANSASLWYDELYTIAFHVPRSWWENMTQGGYSPNNHILSTLLIKVMAWLTDSLTPLPDSPLPVMLATHNTLNFRLASLLAGALLPAALAWKSRKTLIPAAIVGVLALGHPWLIALSTEARGYAIMLLLAALATNALETFERRFSWEYLLAMAAAIYTVPIAGEIMVGHGVAILLLHRAGMKRWGLAAAAVLAVATLLYWPFLSGIAHQVGAADLLNQPLTMVNFLVSLLQHAMMGWKYGGPWSALGALVVLGLGVPLAWRRKEWRAAVISYAAAMIVAVVTAGFVANLRAPRFALWIAPLLVLAASGIVWRAVSPRLPPRSFRRPLFATVAAVLTAGMVWADVRIVTIEPQPIYSALAAADESLAGRGEKEAAIVCVYMGARESVLYFQLIGHNIEIAYHVPALEELEKSGRELRIVVEYPDLLQANEPELAAYIQAHYRVMARLPGRLSDVVIYEAAGKAK